MKKGQAAMEFLMSYGWAILVVMAALGALAYFGVLDPSQFIGETCTMPTGIACDGFKVTQDSFAIVMTNTMGQDLYIMNATIRDCTTEQMTEKFYRNQQVTLVATGCDFNGIGTSMSEDVVVEYMEKRTNLTKKSIGTLKAKISQGGITFVGQDEGTSQKIDESSDSEEEQQETVDEGIQQDEESSDSEVVEDDKTVPLQPIALSPSYAQSYQYKSSTTHDDVTSLVRDLDDKWAPKTVGNVNVPYYLTSTSASAFGALSLRFDTSSIDSKSYQAKLRFYIRDAKVSSTLRHYIIYGEFQTADCEAKSKPCEGAKLYSSGYEGWIEENVPDSYWNDGEMTIRFWGAYVDKVELYLTPIG